MDGGNAVHVPVMVREVLFYLAPNPGELVADCTVGAGGHAIEILKAIQPGGRLIGIDRDAEILEVAARNLACLAGSFELRHATFAELEQVLPGQVDGMLFDLGVSSLQLDRPARGFSFQADGPLDMRMDASRGMTAEQVLKRLPEDELARVIREYGEERFARRVARVIKQAIGTTGLHTTRELAELLERTVRRSGRIHPATRTFQALRIYVNRELDELAEALRKAPDFLRPGGRVVIISYHSLEDRIAKQTLRELAARGAVEILTKKPVRPTPEEVEQNRRSRSARLRAARKAVVSS